MLNPRMNQFNFQFPLNWFDDEICDKYNSWLRHRNGVFQDIRGLVNESIQEVSQPEYGQELYTQILAQGDQGYEQSGISNKDESTLIEDKTFVVTFRLVDGYVNYYLLLEHYFKRYERDSNNHTFDSIPITIYDYHGNIVFVDSKEKVKFTRLSGLQMSHNVVNREFNTFEATFKYDNFNLKFNLPEPNLKLT